MQQHNIGINSGYEMFPKALKTILDIIYKDNTLTSWTLQGNEKGTTIIMRFNMDSEGKQQSDQAVKYRRVPPSQMTRDKKRAQERRHKEDSESTALPSPQQQHAIFFETSKTKTHGSDIDTDIAQYTNSKQSSNPTPPVTRSRAKAVSNSPIPQVDGEVDMKALESKQPIETVTVYGAIKPHSVKRHCYSCHSHIDNDTLVQCCFKCTNNSLFCIQCLRNGHHCEHPNWLQRVKTLSEYMEVPVFSDDDSPG